MYIYIYMYVYMCIYIYIYIYIYYNRYTHVITSRKFQLKLTWQLTMAIAEVKPDTEQTMKLE